MKKFNPSLKGAKRGDFRYCSLWKLGALSLAYAAKFGAISIVGKQLKSQRMTELLAKNRTQFDIELIDKKGGLRKMLSAIKNKRALGILRSKLHR